MTPADLLAPLLEGFVASTLACGLVLTLRRPWRRLFGVASLPLLWALVPAALLAIALPAPVEVLEVSAPATASVTLPAAASRVDSAAPATDLRGPLIALWLLGSLLCGLRFWRLQRAFQRRIGQLEALPSGAYRAQHADVGPAVLGLLRPRIIVPADFDCRFDLEQQQLILAHERSHLRRGDVIAQSIAIALRCLYWFNPLLHFAAPRLRQDQELASDDEVLRRFPSARRRYADTLLDAQLAVPGLPVGCLWQSSHPLKERIQMMKASRITPRRHRLGLAAAAALMVLTGSTLWASQPERQTVHPAATHQLKLQIQAGGERHQPVLQLVAGQPARVEFHAGARQWEAEFVVDRLATGYQVASRLTLDGEPQGEPRLHTAADGGFAFELAGSDPALALRIDGTVAELAAASTATAVSETPSYARITRPRYPAAAAEAGRTGKVVLRVKIDDGGQVQNVAVEHSSADAELDAAAIESVRGWSFNPALENGVRVASSVLVPVCYSMDEQPSCEADAHALDGIWSKPKPAGG